MINIYRISYCILFYVDDMLVVVYIQ